MINICLACDDNYSQYAGVVIASILANSNFEDELTFYILDGGITEENKIKLLELKSIKDCEINFIKIDNNIVRDYSAIKTHSYISMPAYYRLKLPSLLPDVKRVIYFDCDIVVNSSLKQLFNIDLGKYPIAGVKDINKRITKINPNYINSGMLIMDLENMRLEDTEEKVLSYTRDHFEEITMGDQEIINKALKGNIKILSNTWNVQSSNFTNRSSFEQNPKVIHFVSQNKPWQFGSFSYHRNYYFKYLQLTPWKLNERELKHWTFDNQIISLLKYLKYRPLFFLRPLYYKALYYTYIKPLFDYKKPIIKNNTFIVWEPCSKSHSEVVPGYVKYLLDLGYHVSVIVNNDRYKEGLFTRFKDKNVSLNKMSKKQVYNFFKKNNLEDVSGVLVTTVGKLCDSIHYEDCYQTFNSEVDKSKLHFVEHEIVHSVDAGTWNNNLITLRKLNYKNTNSVVVNPHYFGDIKITPKNNETTNFITVGAIQSKKKNNELIINGVRELHNKGIRNFKVTVIGKGHLKNLPKDLQQYFDIKGRLPFSKMYDEIEKADFFITSYDRNNPKHQRYNTTGTSGNFQLVYGFLKPCVILEDFAPINGFTTENSILYNNDENFSKALEECIKMDSIKYHTLQKNLKNLVDNIYIESRNNLQNLIIKKRGQ